MDCKSRTLNLETNSVKGSRVRFQDQRMEDAWEEKTFGVNYARFVLAAVFLSLIRTLFHICTTIEVLTLFLNAIAFVLLHIVNLFLLAARLFLYSTYPKVYQRCHLS